jgi:hypothetical protein
MPQEVVVAQTHEKVQAGGVNEGEEKRKCYGWLKQPVNQ